MTTNRSYNEACGTAHALDLVGERWSLLVVRELVLGAKRYSDLLADLPGISTNVLSHRLDELEDRGIVRRRRLPPPAASRVYELTEWGQELEPIIRQLGRWGARSPSHRRDAHLSATALILSLRTNFDAHAADGTTASYQLRLGEDRFHAQVADGQLQVTRGSAERPDAVLEADPATLAGLVYGGRDLAQALRSGELRIEGDAPLVERFLTLFPLPAPASSPRDKQTQGHSSGRRPRDDIVPRPSPGRAD